MIYVDTSVVVKLYVREAFSLNVSNWIRKNNEAMPLTPFHELEFKNAIHLKRFRKEMTAEEVESIMTRFDDHEAKGVYYRPMFEWSEVFNTALHLTKMSTGQIGCRSLSLLHVASALTLRADRFLTFDEKQARLAKLAGLKIKRWAK